jgi:hypothetical protein
VCQFGPSRAGTTATALFMRLSGASYEQILDENNERGKSGKTGSETLQEGRTILAISAPYRPVAHDNVLY